jgi:hypothetical protein
VTSPAAGLVVGLDGAISTTGTLAAATYTVSGTDSNALGDSGTWTYSLTVNKASQTIIFGAAPTGVVVGGTGKAVSATGGASGNPVTFSSLTPSICTVDSSTGALTLLGVGTCTIAANQLGNANYTAAPQVTQDITVGPALNGLLSDVAAADASFNHIDGFDVLFGKSPSGTSFSVLKNTNPGTFHYQLTLTNETGTTIHGKGTQLPPKYVNNVAITDTNGGSATVYLTVPSLPSNVGTTLPPSSNLGPTDPAFTLQGNHAIHVRPGGADSGPDADGITISYALQLGSASDCSQVTSWTVGTPADGTPVKCIKIEGFSIPKHGKAKIDVNYEFRIKNTDKWAASAQQTFRAGFAFKSTTQITLDSNFGIGTPLASLAGKTYTGNQAVGLVGAGQQVTAVGGFLFDTNGNGVAGATIRLFDTMPSGNACSLTLAARAETTSESDGFYFIWKNGTGQSSTTAANLPSGIRFYEAICGLPFDQAYWPARYIDHKLANKEFDEEDFYISAPTHLAFAGQPSSVRVGRSLGTVTVTVVDAFGNVVTTDNSDSITLSLSPSGALSGTTTRPVVNGVASFTNLTVGTSAIGYTLAASGPFVAATSNSFTIAP